MSNAIGNIQPELGLAHLVIPVGNIERAEHFYGEILGCMFVRRIGEVNGLLEEYSLEMTHERAAKRGITFRLSYLMAGDTLLVLEFRETFDQQATHHTSLALYANEDRIDQIKGRLAEHRYDFLQNDHRLGVIDPWGMRIEVHERV